MATLKFPRKPKNDDASEKTADSDPRPTAGDALGPTLEQFAEHYLKHLEAVGKSRGTVFSYSIDLALAVRELGNDLRVKLLTADRVAAFFESDAVVKTRSGKSKAKPTIDKTRRVLRLALEWAAAAGLIPVAPLPQKETHAQAADTVPPANGSAN